MQDMIDTKEIKKDISKLLERIFMERKVAYDLGLDIKEIDAFIIDEGAKQKERFDNISTEEMVTMMIDEILSYALDNSN